MRQIVEARSGKNIERPFLQLVFTSLSMSATQTWDSQNRTLGLTSFSSKLATLLHRDQRFLVSFLKVLFLSSNNFQGQCLIIKTTSEQRGDINALPQWLVWISFFCKFLRNIVALPVKILKDLLSGCPWKIENKTKQHQKTKSLQQIARFDFKKVANFGITSLH